MKPLVNLSSRPFRNRRLFWLAILLLFSVSALIGFQTFGTISDLDKEIAQLQPQVKKKTDEAAAVTKTGAGVSALTPEETLSMLAARELIQRKAFSWTQLLSEMERLIPGTVRVRKIALSKVEDKGSGGQSGTAPAGNSGVDVPGTVSLSFEVTGRNYNEVLQMVDTFNQTGRFEVTATQERILEGTEEVEFDLQVTYYPLAARRAVAANQVAREGK